MRLHSIQGMHCHPWTARLLQKNANSMVSQPRSGHSAARAVESPGAAPSKREQCQPLPVLGWEHHCHWYPEHPQPGGAKKGSPISNSTVLLGTDHKSEQFAPLFFRSSSDRHRSPSHPQTTAGMVTAFHMQCSRTGGKPEGRLSLAVVPKPSCSLSIHPGLSH